MRKLFKIALRIRNAVDTTIRGKRGEIKYIPRLLSPRPLRIVAPAAFLMHKII